MRLKAVGVGTFVRTADSNLLNNHALSLIVPPWTCCLTLRVVFRFFTGLLLCKHMSGNHGRKPAHSAWVGCSSALRFPDVADVNARRSTKDVSK